MLVPRWLFPSLLWFAIVVGLSGCCGGPEHLTFALVRYGRTPGGLLTISENAPRWGTVETMKMSDEIKIVFGEDSTLPDDVLELYAGDQRVALPSEDRFVPTGDEACAHNEREYSLLGLASGEYTLVHRRRSGTGAPLNCGVECPWTTFDGDEAVVLMLVIEPAE
jgi:hypothetical protein